MSRQGTEFDTQDAVEYTDGAADDQPHAHAVSASDDPLAFGDGEPASGKRWSGPLLYVAVGQLVWMLLTAVILGGLGLFSLEFYFDVSFIGLLVNKVLFAPSGEVPRQWWIVEVLTWAGFAVLVYLVVVRSQELLAAAA